MRGARYAPEAPVLCDCVDDHMRPSYPGIGADIVKPLAAQIEELDGVEFYGRVVGVRGLMVEAAGPLHAMSVGARIVIETQGTPIPCEVVGFSGGNALLMRKSCQKH